MIKTKKYKVKVNKGFVGDFATEWWTDEDWKKHREYVEELKASGEYGKEYEIELNLIENKLLDSIDDSPKPLISYRMMFLDLKSTNTKANDTF